MLAWLILLGAVAVVAGLAWVGLHLARGRYRTVKQTDYDEALGHIAARLGMTEVSERTLFQSRILVMRGENNGFRISAEVCEHPEAPSCRFTIGYPRPLQQRVQILRDAQSGLFNRLLRMREVEIGDPAFDETFIILARDGEERLTAFLNDDLRDNMRLLAEEVDDLRLGDERLFVFVRRQPEPREFERILRDAVALAVDAFNLAVAAGPSRTTRSADYERASTEMFSRETTLPLGETVEKATEDRDPRGAPAS